MKFILLFCLGFTSISVWSQTTEGIAYADNLDFNWGMFRGNANQSHIHQIGEHTAAITVSTISYTTELRNHQAKIRITAIFNPQESWTLYPHLENPEEALNHEKRHFQICEIYARKFRQQVTKTSFKQKTFNAEVEKIFNKLITEYRAEQDRYDLETKHSLNEQQQALWNARIDKDLQALKDFTRTELTITLN